MVLAGLRSRPPGGEVYPLEAEVLAGLLLVLIIGSHLINIPKSREYEPLTEKLYDIHSEALKMPYSPEKTAKYIYANWESAIREFKPKAHLITV